MTEDREAALNHVYLLIASAGGAGVPIDGTQVYARRSLAELETAINAVRGNVAKPAVIARREQDFTALLDVNAAELQVSPGRAWLALVRQDFAESVRLRQEMARYDQEGEPAWHALLEDSAALTAAIQEQLQQPARRGLVRAAQHAADCRRGRRAARCATRPRPCSACCCWSRCCSRSASACRCGA